MPAAIDPPIIISGGGGDTGGGGGGSIPPTRKPAKNMIQIKCDPAELGSPKKFKTKVNKDAEIKSVLIDFPNMPGQNPIVISGYEVYNISITFQTGPSIRTRQAQTGEGEEEGCREASGGAQEEQVGAQRSLKSSSNYFTPAGIPAEGSLQTALIHFVFQYCEPCASFICSQAGRAFTIRFVLHKT